MAFSLQTPARPYAKAAFAFAVKHEALHDWSVWLSHLAVAVTDKQIGALLTDPAVTRQQLIELLTKLSQPQPKEGGEHFIKLLAHKRRLSLLPTIAELFEAMKQHHQQQLNVNLSAAWMLDDAQKKRLTDSLKKRFQQSITLHCTVDKSLLGGLIVRIDDTVIDGSVRGKLLKLRERFQQSI